MLYAFYVFSREEGAVSDLVKNRASFGVDFQIARSSIFVKNTTQEEVRGYSMVPEAAGRDASACHGDTRKGVTLGCSGERRKGCSLNRDVR